ncbi:hypothetical protein CHCC20335_3091 [Bacillus paralicheniformis]|nr:hypothetical protein CHCC20335_3091 [Bacillus paralicheniformis]
MYKSEIFIMKRKMGLNDPLRIILSPLKQTLQIFRKNLWRHKS